MRKLKVSFIVLLLILLVGCNITNVPEITVSAPATEAKIEKKKSKTQINKFLYDKKTSTLRIFGQGDMINYNLGRAPWAKIKNPRHIIIDKGLTSVSDNAFNSEEDCEGGVYNHYKKTETVEISDSVTKIGYSAFYDCENLKKVKLPNKLKKLGGEAFHCCGKLSEIKLPDSLYEIEAGVFWRCKSLKRVELGKNTKTIGIHAFADCYNLEKISIPDSVTIIKDDAFWDCEKLTDPDVLPDNLQLIGDRCFYNAGINKIVIPETVTSIGDEAFYGCDELKTVKIPKSVTKIGYEAFGYYPDGNWGENKTKGFTIKGYKGTAAEKYAKKNGFKFIALDK